MNNLLSSCLILAVFRTTVSTEIDNQVYSFRIADDNGYNLVEASVSPNASQWYPVCYMGYSTKLLSLMCTRAGFSSRYVRAEMNVKSNISRLAIYARISYRSSNITYSFLGCSYFQKVFCISSDPQKYPVRLTGGSNANEGRLEIKIKGVWGTVCDDNFGTEEATIVCRQFTKFPGSVYTGQTRSRGTSPIWLDDVQCTGLEPHLLACRHLDIGTNDCTHSEDVHVNCSAELMLVGGLDERRGRVEIKVGRFRGSVCDDGFNSTAANVVCRQLGFTEQPAKLLEATIPWPPSKIWLDDVKCSGNESYLWDCKHRAWGLTDCMHSEDVVIECPMADDYTLRLQGGSVSETEAYGRLEVKLGGIYKPFCGDINQRGAELACCQMGYPSNNVMVYPRGFLSVRNSPTVLSDVNCNREDAQFKECSFNMSPSRQMASKICGGSMGIMCTDQRGYQIRLVGGTHIDGRVEVGFGGIWGTVCDDGFDQRAAKVVCRQLGYSPKNAQVVTNTLYPAASVDSIIWLDHVHCDEGSETSLGSCELLYTGGQSDCAHSDDVAISCSQSGIITARLMNGPNDFTGRLEVVFNGMWGTVCDDHFDSKAAQVACRQLGLPVTRARTSQTRYGHSSGHIWLDDIHCDGDEPNLQACRHSPIGTSYCAHSGDVSLVCGPIDETSDYSVRLVGGTSSRGKVEVYIDGQWGTVCDDLFDSDAAKVVCRQLGYSGYARDDYSYYSEITTVDILLDDVICLGNERSLKYCSHNTPGTNDCSHMEDVAVKCMGGTGGMASPGTITGAVIGSMAVVIVITVVANYCRSKSRKPPNGPPAGRRPIRSLSQSLQYSVNFQYNNSTGTLQSVPSGRVMIPPTSPGIYGGPPSYDNLFPNGVPAIPPSQGDASPPPYPDPVVLSVPSQPASPPVPTAPTSHTVT